MIGSAFYAAMQLMSAYVAVESHRDWTISLGCAKAIAATVDADNWRVLSDASTIEWFERMKYVGCSLEGDHFDVVYFEEVGGAYRGSSIRLNISAKTMKVESVQFYR